uniref:uncharacterized protein LOC101243438 n=1 Tax=Ciona intestinalis TaxID=7719 RepID=UPI000EF555F7|nr:uncharacterized protein LOC101243438 [Ciona intestinalis]|eukprot:XP_026690114.1 uncharacterized protein LOC101243438 [Ciona intestinalis]
MYKENKVALDRLMQDYLGHIVAGAWDKRYQWKALPGTKKLLETLSKMENVKLALVTGNSIETALSKLRSAAIDETLFMENGTGNLLGAFGCDPHEERGDLVKLAANRIGKILPGKPELSGSDLVVIGDTLNDIKCAHDNQVPCIAVTTGIFQATELEDAEVVLENGFSNVADSIKAIVGVKYGQKSI